MIFLKKQYLFLSSIIVIGLLLIVSYFGVLKFAKKQIISNAKYESIKVADSIKILNDRVEYTLNSIVLNSNFINYVKHLYNQEDSKIVNSLFKTIARCEPTIMQLRYIDKDGDERIRVERNNYDSPLLLIDKASLQNKRHRYYFQQISKTINGEIWSSKLDLNIEHNSVEVPHKPTLRLGIPVYIENEFSGILIVNLFMKPLLSSLEDIYLYNVYVVSQDTHYVIHPNKEFNFSSSLDHNYTLHDEFPLLAKNIDKNEFMDNITYMSTLFKSSSDTLKIILKPKNELVSEFKQKTFLYALLIALAGASTLFLILFYPIRLYLNKTRKILSLKNSEFQTILNETDIAIICINDDKKIVYTNNSALCMLQLSLSEIKDFSIETLFADNRLDDILLQADTSTVDINTAIKNSKQEVFPANVKVHHEGDSKDGYNLFFIKDLTVFQENELNLLEQSKRAAMGDMLMAISHQWRQPLTSLGFAIQYLEAAYNKGKFDDALLKETVSTTNSLIHFMSNTIDNFQFFLKQPKEEEYFLDHNSFDFIIRLVEPILEKANIRLHVQNNLPKSGMQYPLRSEPSELQQVLLNLINNAQDALVNARSTQSSVQDDIITVIMNYNDSEDTLILKVIDNNNGIENTIMDKIFDPYFTTKGLQGNGIGLYIVKIIVERHFHGNIVVKNLRKGVMFTVVIPVNMK